MLSFVLIGAYTTTVNQNRIELKNTIFKNGRENLVDFITSPSVKKVILSSPVLYLNAPGSLVGINNSKQCSYLLSSYLGARLECNVFSGSSNISHDDGEAGIYIFETEQNDRTRTFVVFDVLGNILYPLNFESNFNFPFYFDESVSPQEFDGQHYFNWVTSSDARVTISNVFRSASNSSLSFCLVDISGSLPVVFFNGRQLALSQSAENSQEFCLNQVVNVLSGSNTLEFKSSHTVNAKRFEGDPRSLFYRINDFNISYTWN